MSFETLLVEQHGAVRLITVNRPDRLNALNQTVLRELEAAFDAAAADAATRAIVITGAGPKAFVAGADISEFQEVDGPGAVAQSKRVHRFFTEKIEGSAKPVIAAVNGFALGGGCELALSCHLRVAAENAKFGLPEIKLGLIPGYGGTQRLTRLVGRGHALQMALTGDMIDADKALQIGLANDVCPQVDLVSSAIALANRILANSSKAASLIIQAVNGAENPKVDGFTLECELFGQAIASADGREGVAAFLEKRKANFTGN